jgi:hypothetical protein
MYTLLRQVFVAMLGGVVAAGVMLVANNIERGPSIALAQTSATVTTIPNTSGTDAVDADARKAINYQGQVYNPNGGQPRANQGLNFSFRFFNNPAGTNQVYREDRFIVTNADGFFSTNIGDTGGFGDVYQIFNGQELYLSVFINDQQLGPIQPITFVPYAFWSVHAHHLDEYDADDFPKIIAYGTINANGSRRSGERFNSSIQNVAGSQVVVIDLEGVTHSIETYNTIVTPACDSPIHVGIGTSQGDLVVDIWDTNGNRVQCTIQFMTLEK